MEQKDIIFLHNFDDTAGISNPQHTKTNTNSPEESHVDHTTVFSTLQLSSLEEDETRHKQEPNSHILVPIATDHPVCSSERQTSSVPTNCGDNCDNNNSSFLTVIVVDSPIDSNYQCKEDCGTLDLLPSSINLLSNTEKESQPHLFETQECVGVDVTEDFWKGRVSFKQCDVRSNSDVKSPSHTSYSEHRRSWTPPLPKSPTSDLMECIYISWLLLLGASGFATFYFLLEFSPTSNGEVVLCGLLGGVLLLIIFCCVNSILKEMRLID